MEILPVLPAKTLQNCISRDLVKIDNQNPGRKPKPYYNTRDVIVLGIMAEMACIRIGPTESIKIGEFVADRSQYIIDDATWEIDANGINYIDVPNEKAPRLMRHVVNRHGNQFWLSEAKDDLDRNYAGRKNHEPVYIVIEMVLFAI